MSSESHSVSNFSGGFDSEDLSYHGSGSPEASSESVSLSVEAENAVSSAGAPSLVGDHEDNSGDGLHPRRDSAKSQGEGRAGGTCGSTRPSEGPSAEISSVTEEDLVQIRETYLIPGGFDVSVPGPEGRVDSCPPGFLAVYEEDLIAGLRFPFHRLIREVLDQYRVVPAQLGPNSFRSICAFIVMCHFLFVEPRLTLFRAFFQLNKLPGSKGWYYFGPRKSRKMFSLPTSIHAWKNGFFFVSSSESWGFPTVWGEPDTSYN